LTNKNFHLNTKLTPKNNSELLANGVDGLSGKKLESSANTLEILTKCFGCLSTDDQIWNYLNRDEVEKIISQQSIVDDMNTVRFVSSLLFYMDINIVNKFSGILDQKSLLE
jgi:serine/threonine protein phosphatase PrpC